jgi:hypothetical protein
MCPPSDGSADSLGEGEQAALPGFEEPVPELTEALTGGPAEDIDVYKVMNYPGHIAVDMVDRHVSGCRMWVGTADELNKLFEDHANTADPYCLVDWKPLPLPGLSGTAQDGVQAEPRIAALIGGLQSDEKRELLDVFTQDFQMFRHERGKERRALKEAAARAKVEAESERVKVLRAGIHCLQNHVNFEAKASTKAEKKAAKKGKR